MGVRAARHEFPAFIHWLVVSNVSVHQSKEKTYSNPYTQVGSEVFLLPKSRAISKYRTAYAITIYSITVNMTCTVFAPIWWLLQLYVHLKKYRINFRGHNTYMSSILLPPCGCLALAYLAWAFLLLNPLWLVRQLSVDTLSIVLMSPRAFQFVGTRRLLCCF